MQTCENIHMHVSKVWFPYVSRRVLPAELGTKKVFSRLKCLDIRKGVDHLQPLYAHAIAYLGNGDRGVSQCPGIL